jgi:O-acetyl-ADP-ribose deacetylase
MERIVTLGPETRLIISVGDLTQYAGDAIVNAANETLLGGGGVDGAIHRAAGPELLDFCREIMEVRPQVRCPTGEARLTKSSGALKVSHVIHTVGPVYRNPEDSATHLRNAYRSVLRLANQQEFKRIAFPAISCGAYGYPYKEAAKIALQTCQEEHGNVSEIHFILFTEKIFDSWMKTSDVLFNKDS